MTHNFSPINPSKLTKQLIEKYGLNWKTDLKKYTVLTDAFDLACVERICENLKLLIPLVVCLKLEGITAYGIEKLFKRKATQPYLWAFERFEQAQAQGEADALRQMSHPDSTDRERKTIQWRLERYLEDSRYIPRTQKTVTNEEKKSVSVQMRMSGGINKALPALGPAIDAVLVHEGPSPDITVAVPVGGASVVGLEPIITNESIQ